MALALSRDPKTSRPLRRQELIEAAVATIAEQGLSGTTLAKVAARAGLTAAAVSFHFSSKEALLLETLGHVSEELSRGIREAVDGAGNDPGAGLLALVDVMLDPAYSDTNRLSVWYAFVGESQARSGYQQICGNSDRVFDETVTDLCERLFAEAPEVRSDPQAIANGLAGLLEKEWQSVLFSGEDSERLAAKQRCLRYLASVSPWRFEMPVSEPEGPAALERDSKPRVAAASETLPSWSYQSEAFAALEKEHIFMPAWMTVCHVNDVKEPGDYATFEMQAERAFVIRGSDGRLRAFHNVCRHRAHALVGGAEGSCARAITCPYHSWTYDFDGHLKALPDAGSFGDLDRSRLGLRELDLEIYLGFVFIRFRSEGPSVASRLAPYTSELAHYHFEDYVALYDSWTETRPVDWKNAMDNYLEDYHFPTGHPGLSSLMEADYDREVSATGASRLSHTMKRAAQKGWSVRHYQKILPDRADLPEAIRRRWTYVTLFPANHFDIYPDHVQFFQMLPAGPGRCVLRGRSYGLPGASREVLASRWLAGRINDEVQREDDSLTESVQGGLRSSGYQAGLLSGKEVVVRGFQDWVREKLPVSQLAAQPADDRIAAANRELQDKRT